MIIHLKNGWRDLSDEGPGVSTYLEKDEWEIIAYDSAPNYYRVRYRDKAIARFANESDAVNYVDLILKKKDKKEETILFLLNQLRLRDLYQDIDRIKEIEEMYNVSS